MTAVLAPPESIVEAAPPQEKGELRTLLTGVSWATYESLLKDYANRSAPHLTYDRGSLEIVSPLIRHEENNWLLETLVVILAEEWDVEFRCLQHTTFRRSDADRGVEPDSCFYIQRVAQIEGKDEIDLEGGDPAPDLVLEVDITSPSVAKLPIYAAFGVPEVWLADESSVAVLALEGGAYAERDASAALPRLARAEINRWLAEGRQKKQLEWMRAVRAWAREVRDAPDVRS